MDKTFIYGSQIKDVQNNLLTQVIRENSNLELLNSEEAIRNVIKSYTDKFQSLGNVLIDIQKYVVQSKDLITVKEFNDLFEGMYIDLYALYSDIGSVSQVMDLNLQRNKNYFLVIKKRIRDLWNKLNLIRTYIHDSNPADESYYESFSTDINSSYSKNCFVDKKNGYLYINPLNTNVQNKGFQIKTITSLTYPEPNDLGGVFKTTSVLNTYEDNYSGPRDMLQNGLWKEEYLTSEVPYMHVNIGDNDNPVWRDYKGIVSFINIEYTNLVEFNRIDFDMFGDKPTLIDAILYKEKSDEPWKVLNFEPEDNLATLEETQENRAYPVRGEGFDIITFYNTKKIKAKYLRVIVNQENYSILSKSSNSSVSLENKIFTDLSERRYELIKFDNSIDGMLSNPVNSANRSLYDKIMDIIESTSSIEKIIKDIEKLLLPQIDVVKLDFTDTFKFEVGLWSIEPKLEIYNHYKAHYYSNPYLLDDKSLISASIITKQQNPKASTCNWYVESEGKNIPVVENNSVFRKEPIVPFDMYGFSGYSDWTNGCFVLLDFPIDVLKSSMMSMYINGVYQQNIFDRISFLNSRLIFINDLMDPYNSNYVIRYPAAIYKTVNLWVLTPKVTTNSVLQFGIVSSNKVILESFINNIHFINPSTKLLSDEYTIINALATIEEASMWFGNNFEKCIFISESIFSLINNTELSYQRFNSIINVSSSKLSCTYSDSANYKNGINGVSFTPLTSICNLAPLSNVREL